MSMSSVKASLVLLWFAPWIAACGASHVEMDANTNWLRQCSGSGDCSGDQVCACGVCTVACVSSDSCRTADGPDAVCVSVAAAQCGGGAIETGAVCAERCQRDRDCDGDLSCSAGSCVLVRPQLDSGVSDAQVAVEDASAMEPVDAGVGDVWSGPGCEPAPAQRPDCESDAGCDQGLLCHVDGTCIEPGKCDHLGRATLARVGDAQQLALSADDVHVLDFGSVDGLGNHRRDGSIIRAPIDGGESQAIVTGLKEPWSLGIDAQRVLWRQEDFEDSELWSASRADGSDALLIARGSLAWAHDATHVYFLKPDGDGFTELLRAVKGTADVEALSDEDWNYSLSQVDVDSRYAYVVGGGTFRLPLAGGVATPVAAEGYPEGFAGELELSADRLFYSGHMGEGVWVVGKSEPELIRLAAAPSDTSRVYTLRPFREHVYYVLEIEQRIEIRRTSLIPGEEDERLVTMPRPDVHSAGPKPLAVSDRGLFWVQGQHLLRLVIPAYATQPVQGTLGAACFGDLTCGSNLACVDTVCVEPPPVDPRSCATVVCDAGFACEQGQCLRLWSGEGCDAAPAFRPACSTATSCEPGLVCHIDGTCIEPGKCDRFGRATFTLVADARDLVVTKDSAFVVEYGSDDALDHHGHDGAIVRVSLADGSTQQVVGGIYRPLELLVDADRVYWRAGRHGESTYASADRADGGNPIELQPGGINTRWVQSATHLYFATEEGAQLDYELFRAAKGSSTIEKLTDESWTSCRSMAIDAQYVYLSVSPSNARWSLTGGGLIPAGVPSNAELSAVADAYYYVRVHPEQMGNEIGVMSKASGAERRLARVEGNVLWMRVHRDHVYFVHDGFGDVLQFQRIPIASGEPETLARAQLNPETYALAVAVGDQGLFWVQENRLLRQTIADYALVSPAQGASGGPCFADLACDPGMSCNDLVCQ